MDPERVKRLDARSLRGLAHPLRLRILSSLRLDGPSTATRLARQFGEDSGNISWHLRQLAEHGFIAEDTERGTRRERWWHALHQTSHLDPAGLADAEVSGPVAAYLHHVLDQYFERATAFLAQDWSQAWRQASEFSSWQIEMTPDELRALSSELAAVLERRRAEAETGGHGVEAEGHGGATPDSETVHIQLQTFPRRRLARNPDHPGSAEPDSAEPGSAVPS
jgi:DNA-binding transcriptional ArsR family regulator